MLIVADENIPLIEEFFADLEMDASSTDSVFCGALNSNALYKYAPSA